MKLRTIVLFRACFGKSRLTEFQAVFEREYPQLSITWQWDDLCFLYNGGDYGPTVLQFLPDVLTAQQWSTIAAACISCRGIFQLLGQGETLAQCIAMVGQLSDSEILKLIDGSWAIHIKMLGRSDRLHPTERTKRVEAFREVLNVLTQRKVDLNHPDCDLWLLEDYRHLHTEEPMPSGAKAKHYWLLLNIKSSLISSATSLAERSCIKRRSFIHTTTLPADRSILMNNLAKVASMSTVLDPFCGSGSLLLAAAQLGANTIGSDIDAELLNSQAKPLAFPSSPDRPLRGIERVCLLDSFQDLEVSPPLLLAGLDIQDPNAIQHFMQANQHNAYHSIITDPPYGIRESQSAMNDLQIIELLCSIGAKILIPSGRIVFLRLVECTSANVATIQHHQETELRALASRHTCALLLCSLERFNARLWRATIVLEYQGD